jgi:alpha-beta hydrolase superfamily lysophospholipase
MTASETGGDRPSVVFIHGLWMTPRSWEHWIERYKARGIESVAPAWPGMEGEVEELRRDPSPIARQDVAVILDHYEKIIRAMDRPPILIGHSFGGAFVQVLMDRGLGAAGVGLAAGTVRGVLDLPLSTLRSASSLLRNPLLRHRAVPFTDKAFNYAFCNNLTMSESQPAYERYAVHGSRNVLLTGANANLNPLTPLKVNFHNDARAPLLFIGGTVDHVVPALVNKHNAAKYKSGARTEYKEYAGRTHFTAGQEGWEEVADYAIDWALEAATSGK